MSHSCLPDTALLKLDLFRTEADGNFHWRLFLHLVCSSTTGRISKSASGPAPLGCLAGCLVSFQLA